MPARVGGIPAPRTFSMPHLFYARLPYSVVVYALPGYRIGLAQEEYEQIDIQFVFVKVFAGR